MEPLTLPFTNRFWTDTYEAMVTVRGVLRTEPDGLVVEFKRSEWDFASARKQDDIHAVHIPWPEVQSLTFRRKLLGGGVLVLRTRSLRTLESFPAVKGNELTLSVSRAERLSARELAANVELALAEQRLDALDAQYVPPALPPG
jgi:hypothetical protein